MTTTTNREFFTMWGSDVELMYEMPMSSGGYTIWTTPGEVREHHPVVRESTEEPMQVMCIPLYSQEEREKLTLLLKGEGYFTCEDPEEL